MIDTESNTTVIWADLSDSRCAHTSVVVYRRTKVDSVSTRATMSADALRRQYERTFTQFTEY